MSKNALQPPSSSTSYTPVSACASCAGARGIVRNRWGKTPVRNVQRVANPGGNVVDAAAKLLGAEAPSSHRDVPPPTIRFVLECNQRLGTLRVENWACLGRPHAPRAAPHDGQLLKRDCTIHKHPAASLGPKCIRDRHRRGTNQRWRGRGRWRGRLSRQGLGVRQRCIESPRDTGVQGGSA